MTVMTDRQENDAFEAWWNKPVRCGGEDIPLWQVLPSGGNPMEYKDSLRVAFKSGIAHAEYFYGEEA